MVFSAKILGHLCHDFGVFMPTSWRVCAMMLAHLRHNDGAFVPNRNHLYQQRITKNKAVQPAWLKGKSAISKRLSALIEIIKQTPIESQGTHKIKILQASIRALYRSLCACTQVCIVPIDRRLAATSVRVKALPKKLVTRIQTANARHAYNKVCHRSG